MASGGGGAADKSRRAYVIVLGNEKGGSGKTTTSMHLAVALMRAGFAVATIDLDGRQQTLTRYLENRKRWSEETRHTLAMPEHRTLVRSGLDSGHAAAEEDRARLAATLAELSSAHDFVVIDCPGSDVPLARFAHRLADTLVTPLNDSLLDLDVIVRMGRDDHRFLGPGVYSRMVIEQRLIRLRELRAGMDWILLRNRLTSVASRNRRDLDSILGNLSRTVGCRVARGISERVIYRQLFLSGLTVLDLRNPGMKFKLAVSHVAARQEMRELLEALWLPNLSARLDRV